MTKTRLKAGATTTKAGTDLSKETRNNLDFKKKATNFMLRESQWSFRHEYRDLAKSGKVKPKSILSKQNPFIDEDGVLRANTKLGRLKLEYSARHPIILEAKQNWQRQDEKIYDGPSPNLSPNQSSPL